MISRKTRGNRIGSCDMMSVRGLGRAKTVSMGVGFESKRRMASGHDRSDQRLDPNDVHYPGQIIGEDREGHLGGHLWERFGQEVRRPHAGFHRAERMFDCLSSLTHGFRVCIRPLLHGLEQMLVSSKTSNDRISPQALPPAFGSLPPWQETPRDIVLRRHGRHRQLLLHYAILTYRFRQRPQYDAPRLALLV